MDWTLLQYQAISAFVVATVVTLMMRSLHKAKQEKSRTHEEFPAIRNFFIILIGFFLIVNALTALVVGS